MEKITAGGKNPDAEKTAQARSRWLTKYIGGTDAAAAPGQFRDPAEKFS